MDVEGRSASDSSSPVEQRHPGGWQRLALVALMATAVFAVVYLIAANALLRSRLLRDVISEGPDVELDYASAYSVWPGRVHLRGLSLEVQDYRFQFSVDAESATLQIS